MVTVFLNKKWLIKWKTRIWIHQPKPYVTEKFPIDTQGQIITPLNVLKENKISTIFTIAYSCIVYEK